MTLNLTPYQAAAPYPLIKKVKPDIDLAATLMEGYSGERSELTTVLQYNYHSLCCQKKYEEIALMSRGIFYVETIHLELLGDCVLKLGGDPQYFLTVREKTLCWQAAVVEYEQSPAKMLLADMEGEKYAASFYEQMALKIKQPEIAALMARLAEDEKLHVRMLSDLYRRTFSHR